MNLDDFQKLLDRRTAVDLQLRAAGATTLDAVRALLAERAHLQARIDAALAEAAKEEK